MSDKLPVPTGLDPETFEAMFEGMGVSPASRQTFPSEPRPGLSDDPMTSSKERSSAIFHPDTLLPIEESSFPSNGTPRGSSSDMPWPVGMVLANHGILSKIVPNSPVSRAELVYETTVSSERAIVECAADSPYHVPAWVVARRMRGWRSAR